MAQLILPSGFTIGISSVNLEVLQQTVGGNIEIVHLEDGQIMVVNEDGKEKNLTVNPAATMLLRSAGGDPGDYVAGNAVLCDDDEIE